VDNLDTFISAISNQNFTYFSAERSTRPAALAAEEARLRTAIIRELRCTTLPPFCLYRRILSLSGEGREEEEAGTLGVVVPVGEFIPVGVVETVEYPRE
jgi:hypothetical protein